MSKRAPIKTPAETVTKPKIKSSFEDHADEMAFFKSQHAVDAQFLGAVFHDEAIGIEHDDSPCKALTTKNPKLRVNTMEEPPRSSEMRGLKVRESKR